MTRLFVFFVASHGKPYYLSAIYPALLGFGLVALCVRGFDLYGWSLFLVLPVMLIGPWIRGT